MDEGKNKKYFSAFVLKTLAILAMFSDHAAYAFLDFYTPLAQCMHVFGRLTIPIMCFFVAEGCKKTSNIKKYIKRLFLCYVVSVLPFAYFFGDMYESSFLGISIYRQNIILDLLIGLFSVLLFQSQKLKKAAKILLFSLLMIFSLIVGGWPILPTLYILIFTFGRSFRQKAVYFTGVTLFLQAFSITMLLIDERTNVFGTGWAWYRNLYLLGFLLALIPLSFYNGKRGSKYRFVGYLFYGVYPLHLFILGLLTHSVSLGTFYVLMNVACAFVVFCLAEHMRMIKPSRTQLAMTLFHYFAFCLIVAFILESTAKTLPAAVVAVKLEYLVQYGIIITFTWFISEFCKVRLPRFVRSLEYLFCGIFTYLIFTCDQNHIFYKEMWLDETELFPKFTNIPGIGYYAYYSCVFLILFFCMAGCFVRARKSVGYARKRAEFVMLGTFAPGIEMVLVAVGVTKGYDFIALAIVIALLILSYATEKFGYFNSLEAANENMLKHGEEGILMVDEEHRIVFFNNIVEHLIPEIKENTSLEEIDCLKGSCEIMEKNIRIGDQVFDVRRDILYEDENIQGYMFWLLDMTEHYRNLELMRMQAEIDSLTGLYNRRKYEELLNEKLCTGVGGAHIMLDLDNFKGINDKYGHKTGDQILCLFAEVLKSCGEEGDFFCRIGGDEFCCYLSRKTNHSLTEFSKKVLASFAERLVIENYAKVTSVSIGVAIIDPKEKDTFTTIFIKADRALYVAKGNGKNCYVLFKKERPQKKKNPQTQKLV